MAEIIVAPDVEDLIRRHLGPLIGSAIAYAAITPTALPAESVTAIRTGGARRDLVIDVARVSLDCRSIKSLSSALYLARICAANIIAAAMDGMLAGTPCYSATEVSGPYLNPDPSNPKQHRYTVALEVAVRCSVV